MSAVRTQIYLTPDQRARIDELANTEGVTMAQVIRNALDTYLDAVSVDSAPALAQTFGSIPDAQAPPRGEWQRE